MHHGKIDLRLKRSISSFKVPEVGVGAAPAVVLLLIVRVRNHGGVGREVAGRVRGQEKWSTGMV